MATIEHPHNARSRRTAAALLQAARELIEQDGLTDLTMTAVAERAGITRRSVYLHYATRTELLTALYRSLGETDDLAASLQAVWDSPDAASALTEWAEHIARAHPRILGVLRAVERARAGDPDAADLWQTTQTNWHRGSTRLMTWLADNGRLAAGWTVEDAADMMWALMSLDVLERLHTDRRWTPRQFADHLATLFHRTFVTGEATPAAPPTPDGDDRPERLVRPEDRSDLRAELRGRGADHGRNTCIHGGGTAGHLQPLEDVLEVLADGRLGDRQTAGDRRYRSRVLKAAETLGDAAFPR